MIDGLAGAFTDLMTWPSPLYLMLGVVLGLVVGILPGIGGGGAMALLIPFTFGMSPAHGIAFLMAVGASSGIGGQITSILVSIPGDPPNAATVIDGYAMTKQGKAAEALGAATWGSMFGAVFGMALFLIVLPLARNLVLAFSYPDFFMIAVAGLVVISSLTGGKVHKGLAAAGVGLLVSFVGLDPVSGNPRFAFGTLYLWDGIPLVPALVGLFAGSEMLALFSVRGSQSLAETDPDAPVSRMIDGLYSTLRAWKTVIVSSFIGFFAGLVPGISGTLAAFVAYGQAKRMSKNPDQFGHGAVEGVIAPETANDADKGGGLLPTLAFGIPGGVIMAVLLSGLILHGVPAGPNLLRGDLHIVYVLVVAALLPRFVAGGIVLAVGTRATVLTRMRGDVLAPIITVIALIGVYALRNEPIDVLLALVFSYVGYGMEAHGFSRLTFIIAMVLGSLIESSYHQTLQTFGLRGFVTRPIALILLFVTVATLAGPPILKRIRRRRLVEVGGDRK